MATVLIIATDRMIGGLLGQLTDLAGHAAQFGGEGEALSDAVRQSAPDVVMLDAAYGTPTTDAVADAATEVGASVVYFGAALPAADLRHLALERGAKYFPLPAGPRLLGQVLSAALADGRPRCTVDRSSIARYAVTAALAAVSRARMLLDRSSATKAESRTLWPDREAALANCRRSYAHLREAVIAYTRELRSAGVPPDRTLEMIKSVFRGVADAPRAAANAGEELDDAVEWCLSSYFAA